MAFRRQPSNPNPYPFANQPGQPGATPTEDPAAAAGSPTPGSRKRARAASDVGDGGGGGGGGAGGTGDPFHHENGSDASEGSDDGGKPDKKAGRRKIKIEFIQDKSRRHITFSKRKAGIMKKAYELSTLTGTQVLLLVVSETGLVYTFTTAKLQPLVTQPEGKNLIQACLNAPHGSMPSSLPVGTPIGRSTSGSGAGSGGVGMGGGPTGPGRNVPGGLAIGGEKESDADHGPDDDVRDDPSDPPSARGAPPQRRTSNASASTKSPDGQSHSPTQGHRKPVSPSSPHAQHQQPQPQLGGLPPLHHSPPYPGGPYPSPGQGNPGLVGLGGVGVGPIDPGMYGHHSHYLPQQGAGGAGPGGYMGAGGQGGQPQGGHWPPPGQAGYARR